VPAKQDFLEGIMFRKLGRLPLVIKGRGEADILPSLGTLKFLETQSFLFVGTFAAMPLGKVAEDELEEAGQMLRLADGAGKDQGTKAIVVEQPVVKGHELEVRLRILVQELDQPEAIVRIHGRDLQTG
jgi:hypothetical protein